MNKKKESNLGIKVKYVLSCLLIVITYRMPKLIRNPKIKFSSVRVPVAKTQIIANNRLFKNIDLVIAGRF
jgi:hypothetical protein